MIERIDGDITTLANFFSQFLLLLLSNFILLVTILIILFFEDWRVGTAFTLFVLMAFIIMLRIWNLSSPFFQKVRQASADLFGSLEEIVSGKEDLVSINASPWAMQKFHHWSRKEYSITNKAVFVSRLIQVTAYGMIALVTTLVFVTGIPLYEEEMISIGVLYLIYAYSFLLVNPIIQIVRQLQDLSLADASINRITDFFQIDSKIKDTGTILIPEIDNVMTLEFENLTFSYDDGASVLQDISFILKPGKSIGLIGRTGSGKTTLSRLIFRLYDPQSGLIKIDGTDIKAISLKDLRSKIAYVTQSVELFQASLRDNVTFFNKNISDEYILQVINEVGLSSWYNRLLDGLDSSLGDIGLSAGEEQLLALTRVFLQNPKIVVLDEASSRLDPITERLLEQAIDKLLKGRSAIVIAHRLKTLNRVDEICYLENGKIVEFGDRKLLTKDSTSKYCYLLQTGIEEVLG
jgi:ATP-binding cassette subfamily B protein/ATP-binding cassette subfamily C protein